MTKSEILWYILGGGGFWENENDKWKLHHFPDKFQQIYKIYKILNV